MLTKLWKNWRNDDLSNKIIELVAQVFHILLLCLLLRQLALIASCWGELIRRDLRNARLTAFRLYFEPHPYEIRASPKL